MLDNTTPFYMPVQPSNGGNSNGFWSGDGIWAVIIFALIFGWGGNGIGGFGGGSAQNYTLASDFATIQRQLSDGFGGVEKGLDTIRNGLCDGFYTEAQLVNGVNTNILNSTNALNNGIRDVQFAVQTSGNAIQNQMQSCCCEIEKQNMQTNYNMATQNCATLQAIDKVGDRIIDYLAADKAQALRDENQALRLAASQAAQNNFIQNLVKPPINPCYVTQNPYCSCGNAGFYGYGSTIA